MMKSMPYTPTRFHPRSCPRSRRLLCSSLRLHTAQLRSRERVNLRNVHQGLDSDLFTFGIARPTGRAVIHGLDAVATEHAGVRAPGNNFPLRWLAHDALMIGVDGFDHFVVFADSRAGHGHIGLKFQPPVGTLLL